MITISLFYMFRVTRFAFYRLLAPLGILFPFPVHCSKLDSYLRNEEDIRVRYGKSCDLM